MLMFVAALRSRRDWAYCAVVLVCLAVLAGCTRQRIVHGASVADRNVVIITIDTTRADHLGCYAGDNHTATGVAAKHASTPNLDALAARGVRFRHATAQEPLTLPSHACIMTGAYPQVNGLRNMGGFILEKSHPTLASIAQANGFATAAFVGSKVLSKRFGISNGFQTYDDEMPERIDPGALPGVFPERRAAVVTDRALAWLKQNGDRKFVLWVHYYDPHAPYDPPEPYKTRYRNDLYSGEIAYTDAQIGRLLNGLNAVGQASRTLVIAMADHGESLGEHGEATHGVFLYDSTLHIPMIMAGPDIPAGKVIDTQVRSIDVMPTALAFLGLSPGKEAQGANLGPLIRQERHVGTNYSYLETLYPRTFMGWSELRAMRTDNWKYIVAPKPELYDLVRDPAEKNNLIARNPAEADQLKDKIWQLLGSEARQEKLTAIPMDSETREQLASLGYASAGSTREIQLGTAAPDPKDRVDVLNALNETERLMGKKEYAAAVRLIHNALAKDPSDALAMNYLAVVYENMGQIHRAIAVYEHAVALKLGTDQIYSRLGRDYLRLATAARNPADSQRQISNAITAMEHAEEINPTDLDNLRNLGTAYLQTGRAAEAEKAFRAVLVQNDKYASAYNGLGLIAVQRGDGDTARQDFQKAIDLDPTEVEPLLNLGVLYQKAGQKDMAVHYLTMFLDRAPRAQYGYLLPEVRQTIADLRGSGS